MKPVIGIITYGTVSPHGNDVSCLNTAYSDAIIKNGGIPLVIPYTESSDTVHCLIDMCRGLLVPGGDDIVPSLYGESPHEKLGATDALLDRIELDALEHCIHKRLPVFGICRGCQLMNVYAGGTLWQDIPSQYESAIAHRQTENRRTVSHGVELSENSLLFALLGKSTWVNSLHHQAIRAVGRGFHASAKAPDGIIEAVEHENGLWFAVQWHPEELIESCPEMNRLFTFFIGLCAERKT